MKDKTLTLCMDALDILKGKGVEAIKYLNQEEATIETYSIEEIKDMVEDLAEY